MRKDFGDVIYSILQTDLRQKHAVLSCLNDDYSEVVCCLCKIFNNLLAVGRCDEQCQLNHNGSYFCKQTSHSDHEVLLLCLENLDLLFVEFRCFDDNLITLSWTFVFRKVH